MNINLPVSWIKIISVQNAVLVILSFAVNLLLFQGLVSANMEMYAETISTLEKRLSDAESRDVIGKGSVSVIKDTLKDLNDLKLSSTDFHNTIEVSLAKIDEALLTLGTVAVRGEPDEVAVKRKELLAEKKQLENYKSRINLLLIQNDEVINNLTSLQKNQLTTHLFVKGEDIVSIVRKNLVINYAATISKFSDLLFKDSGISHISITGFGILSIILIVLLLFALKFRKKLLSVSVHHQGIEQFANQLYGSFLGNLARYLPQLTITLTLAIFIISTRDETAANKLLHHIVYVLPVYFLTTMMIQSLFSSSYAGHRLFTMTNKVATSLCRRLHILLLLGVFSYVFFSALIAHSLPSDIILLARSVFLVLLVINLVWLVWILRAIPGLKIVASLPVFVSIILIAGLGADLLGYRNLALSIFRITLGVSLAGSLFVLLNKLQTDLFDGISAGQLNWQKRLRASFGNDEGNIPGLFWVRITVSIFLWSLFTWSVLNILGLSDQAMQTIYLGIIEGFNIGSINIIPSRVLLALLVFAILYLFSNWFRVKLDEQWLIKSGMERGSREAMVTISWYIAISIAFLLAISIAGVTFTNLTIIAGALSVGIGFGLQNIVNNFVSGLILLFERPVKRGDWVVVGSTEGYVKNIRIRSTQIQTFDKADVIVPNSDLISNQVTNWMLYDNAGRIRIAIGVAYGSDTDKVKEVLEEVGASHEQVIKNVPKMEPKVLFMSFGESSLDFELRCHIKNIDGKFQVTSDLNFAIDKAFRAAKIEIAFPQRDIHIKKDIDQESNGPETDEK